jgi:TonB family protein
MKRLWSPLLATALTAASPASAQQVTMRAGNWDMLRDGTRCGARLAGADGATLTLWVGGGRPTILELFAPRIAPAPGSRMRLRLAVTGSRISSTRQKDNSFESMAIGFGDGTRAGLAFVPEPGVMAALWAAQAIDVAERGKRASLAHFPAAASASADSELHRCRIETGRIDRGSAKPVVTPGQPLVPAQRIITSDDYPAAALRDELTGRSVLRLTVSAKGLVSGCETATSSGHVVLDQAACLLYSRRARFTPALDADGNPTEAQYFAPVSWLVGG